MTDIKVCLGFTFLEVMIALTIMAIALVAALGLQSQSISLATEAKFKTTAALLAQGKMAEIETMPPENLVDNSGDFGEDFTDYHWDMTVNNVVFPAANAVYEHVRQIDLTVSWGIEERYKYHLRLYRFTKKPV